jgi:hypothetical protein
MENEAEDTSEAGSSTFWFKPLLNAVPPGARPEIRDIPPSLPRSRGESENTHTRTHRPVFQSEPPPRLDSAGRKDLQANQNSEGVYRPETANS